MLFLNRAQRNQIMETTKIGFHENRIKIKLVLRNDLNTVLLSNFHLYLFQFKMGIVQFKMGIVHFKMGIVQFKMEKIIISINIKNIL